MFAVKFMCMKAVWLPCAFCMSTKEQLADWTSNMNVQCVHHAVVFDESSVDAANVKQSELFSNSIKKGRLIYRFNINLLIRSD